MIYNKNLHWLKMSPVFGCCTCDPVGGVCGQANNDFVVYNKI